MTAGTGEWALDSPGSCQPGPCGLGRAPIHLGLVLFGVYSRSWGRSSAFSSGPGHAWQSKAGHPTGHKDTVPLIRAKHCMQGRQGPGAVLSPLLALHLFRKQRYKSVLRGAVSTPGCSGSLVSSRQAWGVSVLHLKKKKKDPTPDYCAPGPGATQGCSQKHMLTMALSFQTTYPTWAGGFRA